MRMPRQLIIFGLAFIYVIGSTHFTYGNTNAVVDDEWGIYFEAPGQKPEIDISEDELKAYGAYYVGNDQDKYLYLTFDCGYESGYTWKMLDILQKTDVPATFFLLGSYIRNNPALVERMIDEGHMVANHSTTHPENYVLSDIGALHWELATTEKIFSEITHLEMPKYYRPPRGKFNLNSLRAAQELGYKTIFWSLAHVDWDENNQPSNWAAIEKLVSCVHPGAVILLHNTSHTNVIILEELINKYKQMGYSFMRLNTLVGA